MKQFTSKTQKIGELGEDLACRFLMKHGFEIIERNYTKKCGEIDIICRKSGITHFIEVKSVSCENTDNVTYETSQYKPEDNLHPAKLKRISRTVQIYLMEKNMENEDWYFDLVSVFIDVNSKKAKFRKIKNIIL